LSKIKRTPEQRKRATYSTHKTNVVSNDRLLAGQKHYNNCLRQNHLTPNQKSKAWKKAKKKSLE